MKSIYIAGHTGLVGSALVRRFSGRSELRVLTAPRAELNLLDTQAVERFLKSAKPEAVVIAAGRVGGIASNSERPAEFIYENLMMEANLIHGSWKAGVGRLLNFGSSCMYPKEASQPMRCEDLFTGKMESTSEAYATAKWAGLALARAYRTQYGVRYVTAIPATVYGPGDNFDPKEGHVLSALISRFHQAKEQSQPNVVLWGSGRPRRDFLYSDDLAEACERLLEHYEEGEPINIGSGQVCSIRELAGQVARVVGFRGEIVWDSSRPDGAPEKRLESTRIRVLGWVPKTELTTGLERTYEWFISKQGVQV